MSENMYQLPDNESSLEDIFKEIVYHAAECPDYREVSFYCSHLRFEHIVRCSCGKEWHIEDCRFMCSNNPDYLSDTARFGKSLIVLTCFESLDIVRKKIKADRWKKSNPIALLELADV